jgi:DNA-3-methyladenine glycosylase
MFGPPGHAYVYMIYGIYNCLNVVTEPEGRASAVLLRALEPVDNLTGRTQGPGLLCRAMEIDRLLSGHDLVSDTLFLARPAAIEPFKIAVRPRIGVAYAGEWADKPLRFYVQGNPFVSRK